MGKLLKYKTGFHIGICIPYTPKHLLYNVKRILIEPLIIPSTKYGIMHTIE